MPDIDSITVDDILGAEPFEGDLRARAKAAYAVDLEAKRAEEEEKRMVIKRPLTEFLLDTLEVAADTVSSLEYFPGAPNAGFQTLIFRLEGLWMRGHVTGTSGLVVSLAVGHKSDALPNSQNAQMVVQYNWQAFKTLAELGKLLAG